MLNFSDMKLNIPDFMGNVLFIANKKKGRRISGEQIENDWNDKSLIYET